MIVDVTQEDIDNGMPCKSGACPITLAARRVNPHVSSTGLISMGFYDKKSLYLGEALLPEEARQFILDFDLGAAVEPFSFEIEPPYTPFR